MLEFINRMLGKESASKNIAKERLRLVLVHDRADISPQMLNSGAHVACMPDTAWPVGRPPPGSSRSTCDASVAMPSSSISTRRQRFAHARLPGRVAGGSLTLRPSQIRT